MREQRHVMQNRGGGWDVVRPGSSRPSSHHETQEAALEQALMLLRQRGGGELVVRDADGQISARKTVAAAPQPARYRA